MSAWLFTIDLPLYQLEAVDRILEAPGDRIESVVVALLAGGLMLREQYRMFGPVDALRMGRLLAGGPSWG